MSFPISELCNEVSDYLPLNDTIQVVLYVKLTQLYCP